MADTEKNILINIDLETGQVNSQLDEIDGKIKDLGKGANPDSFRSIKTQIREAREEAVRLAIAIEDAEKSGQNVDSLSRRFAEVTDRAAQLTDAVEDVNSSIANANPDNRLQGLVSIAQGAIVAIQGVAGAFALIGVDAETAQVAVARLQGLIALTDAISSIDRVKRGFDDLTRAINFSAIAGRANNIVTAAAIALQRAFTGAVNTTTVSFRALRTAIALTGIGLLVTGITALISVLSDFSSATAEATSENEKFRREIELTADSYDKEIEKIQELGEVRLSELRAQGASAKQQREADLQNTLDALAKANNAVIDLERKVFESRRRIESSSFFRFLGFGISPEELKAAEDRLEAAQETADKLSRQALIKANNNRAADLEDTKRTQREKNEVGRQGNIQRDRDLEELKRLEEDFRNEQKRANQTQYQNELDELNKRYERAKQLARAYGRDITQIQQQQNAAQTRLQQQFLLQGTARSLELQLDAINRRVETLSNNLGKNTQELLKAGNLAEIRTLVRDISELFEESQTIRIEQIKAEADTVRSFIKEYVSVLPANIRAEREKQLRDIVLRDVDVQIAALKKETAARREELQNELIFNVLRVGIDERNVRESLQNVIIASQRASLAFADILNKNQRSFLQVLQQNVIAASANIEQLYLDRGKLEIAQANRQKLIRNLDFLGEIGDLERERDQKLAIFKGTNQQRLDLENDFNTRIQFLQQLADEQTVESAIATSERLNSIDKERQQAQFENRKQLIDAALQARNSLQSITPGQSSFARSDIFDSERQRFRFDQTLRLNAEYFQAQTELENAQFTQEFNRLKAANESTEQLEKQHKQNLIDIESNYANNVQLINDSVLQNKLDLLSGIGAAIGNLGRLFDAGTKEAKTLAIAEIAINTATGFIQGLDLAQKTARAAPPPAIPFVFAAFYASQVASVLGAAARAKQILDKVPGAQPPTETGGTQTPQAINASLFNLPQQVQNVRVTGQPSQVVRAFITQEDLRTAQERQQFLNKLSQF